MRGDKTPLAPGMCFSNEPMIVIPETFGVRLEDHFHVTQDGAAWFTEPQDGLDAPSAGRPRTSCPSIPPPPPTCPPSSIS